MSEHRGPGLILILLSLKGVKYRLSFPSANFRRQENFFLTSSGKNPLLFLVILSRSIIQGFPACLWACSNRGKLGPQIIIIKKRFKNVNLFGNLSWVCYNFYQEKVFPC